MKLKQHYKEKNSNFIAALKLSNRYFAENNILKACGYLKNDFLQIIERQAVLATVRTWNDRAF